MFATTIVMPPFTGDAVILLGRVTAPPQAADLLEGKVEDLNEELGSVDIPQGIVGVDQHNAPHNLALFRSQS